MKDNKGFIQQTANDYDMDFDLVERIYNLWWDKGQFYDKLEEELKTNTRLYE